MALLPLHDSNPRVNVKFHYVTVMLIALNALAFFYQLGLDEMTEGYLLLGYGVVPARIFGDAVLPFDIAQVSPIFSLVTYQFLHGGWGHLIFNMLFLWIFGDNVEDAMGHLRFAVFYLACGIAAGLIQASFSSQSEIPVIGASGAISGILGAYLILHPHARVLVLVFSFIPWRLPAMLVLGFFFLQDLFSAFAAPADGSGQNVAFLAHIGGFIAGAILIVPFRFRHVKLFHRPRSPWK